MTHTINSGPTPLAMLGKKTNAARARAKVIAANLFHLRNICSLEALDLVADLRDVANEFEVLANDLQYAIKSDADARYRA